MTTALVTGCAGFIGFHLTRRLLKEGIRVVGVDGLTNYYDPNLKRKRLEILLTEGASHFEFHQFLLEDRKEVRSLFQTKRFDYVFHLAAQAGVRYSLENPRSYIDSNVQATFELLECLREHKPKHFLFASTSSAYGANDRMPFVESQSTLYPMSLYAATKLACESMAHSYAYAHDIPTTVFRFFTVYGPWGRPDMALFKFVKAILSDQPIDVYNYGEMYRDFTYIDDLVEAIVRLRECIPVRSSLVSEHDTLSPVAPYRLVNIGNSKMVSLNEFISTIEEVLGKKANKNLLPIQIGDVPKTWASNGLIKDMIGSVQSKNLSEGVKEFVDWFLDPNVNPLTTRGRELRGSERL